MSKVSARWLAPMLAAAVLAAPAGLAAADTGADQAGYTLTVPDQVVIAAGGCANVPYSIGMTTPERTPGDREDGGPVTITAFGETHSSPSGWGEIGTTPTGATTGSVQVCDAAPGNFQASTSYTAYDSSGNILGAFIIFADFTFVAPSTTKTPTTTAAPHKKKCKRVRRHHHRVHVCRR